MRVTSGRVYRDRNSPGFDLFGPIDSDHKEEIISVPFNADLLGNDVKVVLGIDAIDTYSAKRGEARVNVTARNISKEGFDLKITVWRDGGINFIGVSYLAYSV